MKSCRSLKVASLVGLLGAFSASACTDDSASLHVICSALPDVSPGGCAYDPSGEECIFQGRLNPLLARSYNMGLRVESGLTSRASDTPVRAETNRISLTGGSVEMRRANGAPLKFEGLPNPYPFLASGSVPPEQTAVMSVTSIPPEYVQQLRENAASSEPLSHIVLAIKVRGITDGQREIESSEWLWPVELLAVSPDEMDRECSRFETICQSMVGTDMFAEACFACFDENGQVEACTP